MNILLTVAYDGTQYSGFQKQKSPQIRTVEGELERAIQSLFRNSDLNCIGASRTDKGVHALGQRVLIQVETTIPPKKIPLAIRSYLPEDIVVTHAQEVPDGFHPRYDCIKKTYRYHIIQQQYKNPLERLYGTFVYTPLDVNKMNEAAAYFVGTHDFAAFCAAGSTVTSTIRTIFDCHVIQQGNSIDIFVTGDGFLYNMVRILSGTLIQIGQGKRTPECIKDIIASKDRTQAGQTAEPQGLTLMEIYYNLA